LERIEGTWRVDVKLWIADDGFFGGKIDQALIALDIL
jgi:hypothetical protein